MKIVIEELDNNNSIEIGDIVLRDLKENKGIVIKNALISKMINSETNEIQSWIRFKERIDLIFLNDYVEWELNRKKIKKLKKFIKITPYPYNPPMPYSVDCIDKIEVKGNLEYSFNKDEGEFLLEGIPFYVVSDSPFRQAVVKRI